MKSVRLSQLAPVLAAIVGLAMATDATSANAQSRAPVRAPSVSAPGAPGVAAPATEGVVNINSAGADELVRLPGVGPSRAAAIVALRQRVQRFRSPDELQRVRGIGRASLRRLRPYVTLTGETTLSARPGRSPRAARSVHGTVTLGQGVTLTPARR